MKYKLTQNLGLTDARFCNDHFGAGLDLSVPGVLVADAEVNLPVAAAEYLRKKYPSLLEETAKESSRSVRGVSESAKVKGVSEQTA